MNCSQEDYCDFIIKICEASEQIMWVAVKAPSLDASKTRLEKFLSGLKYMSLIPPQSHKACQVTSQGFSQEFLFSKFPSTLSKSPLPPIICRFPVSPLSFSISYLFVFSLKLFEKVLPSSSTFQLNCCRK